MNSADLMAMTSKRLKKELKQLEKSDDNTIYLRPIAVGEVSANIIDNIIDNISLYLVLSFAPCSPLIPLIHSC